MTDLKSCTWYEAPICVVAISIAVVVSTFACISWETEGESVSSIEGKGSDVMNEPTRWQTWPLEPDPSPPRIAVVNADATVEIEGVLHNHSWTKAGGGQNQTRPAGWPDLGFARRDADTLRFYTSATPGTVMINLFTKIDPETGKPIISETGSGPFGADFSLECHPATSDCGEIGDGFVSVRLSPRIFGETEYMTVFAVWPVPPREDDPLPGQVYANWQFFFDNRQ